MLTSCKKQTNRIARKNAKKNCEIKSYNYLYLMILILGISQFELFSSSRVYVLQFWLFFRILILHLANKKKKNHLWILILHLTVKGFFFLVHGRKNKCNCDFQISSFSWFGECKMSELQENKLELGYKSP